MMIEHIGKTLIIACTESTQILEEALNQEGFTWQVLRQENHVKHQGFSPSYLCLLNHKRAWEIAANQCKLTLILEADFIPVVGFGKLPLPFDINNKKVGISWLYTCAPQLYNISGEGYADGFSVSTVAYIVTPEAAMNLIELEEKTRREIDPYYYSSWDSTIDKFLRDKKFINYIPFRNYGEHGGIPNLEHVRHGLAKTHRADILYGNLAFIPMYACAARNNKLRFFIVRLLARIKGIIRLIFCKFLRYKVIRKSRTPIRLIFYSIHRQLSIKL